MSKSHLIIGLGGTGGKIIRAFRKTIYKEYREIDPKGTNIGYLYIDSDDAMMKLEDPTWKILSKSVQLPEADKMVIRGKNLKSVLDNIDSYPGIQPWIGDKGVWNDVLDGIIGDAVGSQRRRLGRFLFASNTGFKNKLDSQVSKLQKNNNEQDVTFHVCCGLAGGTGSGTVTDVISQIRKNYPVDENGHGKYKIILYTFLPEKRPAANRDMTGYYHANGYAALKELNALSAPTFKPYDVFPAGSIPATLDIMVPFNGCYLFSNENEYGHLVDVDNTLPEIIGDFLFQKIIAINTYEIAEDLTIEATILKQENAENGDGTPEKSASGELERSKRFLTFGIKRLAIPDEEIREYMTLTFANQAALHLLNNNWNDDKGWDDRPQKFDAVSYVKQKEIIESWLLSDENLILSKGILKDDIANKSWKQIDDYWQRVSAPIMEEAQKEKWEIWLKKLSELFADKFDNEYRANGVKTFYQNKESVKNIIAAEILEKVESSLMNEWHAGNFSMTVINDILENLRLWINDKITQADAKVVRYREEVGKEEAKVQNNEKEFSLLGPWSRSIMSKHKNLLIAQTTVLTSLYTLRNKIAGYEFAKSLLQELSRQLSDFQIEVKTTLRTLNNSIEEFVKQTHSRLNDEGEEDLKKHLIRVYDRNKVIRMSSRFTLNKSLQRTTVDNVRSKLLSTLGKNNTFKNFNSQITPSVFQDSILLSSTENVELWHDNLIKEEQFLGQSIVQKLKEKYGDNEQALNIFARDIIKQSGIYLSFNRDEINKKGDGYSGSGKKNKISTFAVIIPDFPEDVTFLKALKRAFETNISIDDNTEVKIVLQKDTKRKNEITLIKITNLFPLRFVSQLEYLKNPYDLKVIQTTNVSEKENHRMILHLEGDGQQHPELYVKTVTRDEYLPYLLIAKSMGLFAEVEDHRGVSHLALVRKDELGFDLDPILLGEDLNKTKDNMSFEDLKRLKTTVENGLKTTYLRVDSREPLIQKIIEDVNNIKIQRGNNPLDTVSKLFNDSGREAVKLLKQLQ